MINTETAKKYKSKAKETPAKNTTVVAKVSLVLRRLYMTIVNHPRRMASATTRNSEIKVITINLMYKIKWGRMEIRMANSKS